MFTLATYACALQVTSVEKQGIGGSSVVCFVNVAFATSKEKATKPYQQSKRNGRCVLMLPHASSLTFMGLKVKEQDNFLQAPPSLIPNFR